MNSNIIFNKVNRQLLAQFKGLTYSGVRFAGNKHSHDHSHDHGHGHGHVDHKHDHSHDHHDHGHHDHHHDHHQYVYSKVHDAKLQIPTDEDIAYQLPKKAMFNQRLYQWIAGRWTPDRDDVLCNDKVNKFSAYYWFGHYSFLQSRLVLSLVRSLFDSGNQHASSHHDNFSGVKSHENGQFLYKSSQADGLVRQRFIDYVMLGCLGATVTGVSQVAIMPFLYFLLFTPRKVAIMNYFTFYAELLPHTEQVVFHKVDFFGSIRRIYVDIRNLEKVDATLVHSKLLWNMNLFDQELVFRDSESGEVFVFETNGLWNKETLENKLIN